MVVYCDHHANTKGIVAQFFLKIQELRLGAGRAGVETVPAPAAVKSPTMPSVAG